MLKEMQTAALGDSAWQWEPGGQSSVLMHATNGRSGLAMQCCAPSTVGPLQPLVPPTAGQSTLSSQTTAQLPLPRHCWPVGQLAQETGCPQLFVHAPQRPAQVALRGSGVQQVLPWQTWFAPHAPHEPPQPSLPQTRSVQFSMQVALVSFFFF